MKDFKYIWLLLLLILNSFGACSDDDPLMPGERPSSGTDPAPEEQVLHDGFNFDPAIPKADEPLTITFKAPEGSNFYGYADDLYLHSGTGANWTGAPTWGDNQNKYRLKKTKDNVWSITLSSSIRHFYSVAPSTPLQTINLIVRDAEGSQQTYDYATLVEDSQNGFIWEEPQKAPLPISGEEKEGIHIHSATSIMLVLYDKDSQGGHKDCVFVTGNFNNWKLDSRYMMKYDETNHCWWITLEELTAGETHFQYFVYSASDGGTYLCDPYCEQALEKGVDTNFPTGAQAPYVSVVSTNPQPYQWSAGEFEMKNKENPVIYELLLRDFTSSGNLAGAMEKLPYLKELGIDAIELMPVQEFAGNDSWGYNTGLYFALDASYGTQNEYKAFIDACHQNGIAVIFDVVYNHTNNDNPFARMYWDTFNNRPSTKNPWLNAVTPHQKYVFSPDDFNHTSEQTKAFVKRNLKYLLDTYHIDGFRFDLVGLIDTETINEVVTEVHKTHPDVIFYGEGWTMDTAVTKDGYKMTTQPNSTDVPGFAFFSDTLRDALKGHVFYTTRKGYVSGAADLADTVKGCFLGQADDWCTTPSQSINYASCHDNMTLLDRITKSTPGASKEDHIRMNNLSAAIYMTAQGIPFLQAGEEMLRAKIDASGDFVENSYNSPDSVNSIKWDTLEDEAYQNVYNYYKGLIAFRKAHAALRLTNAADVHANITSVDGLDENVLAFRINGGVNGETSDGIFVIFNPNKAETSVALPDGAWDVCVNADHAGTGALTTVADSVSVEPISAMVLVKKK